MNEMMLANPFDEQTLSTLLSSSQAPNYCFIQLDRVDEGWGAIFHAHRMLLTYSQKKSSPVLLHLSVPTFHFFDKHPSLQRIASEEAAIDLLPRQLNTLALSSYCEWLYQDIMRYLKELPPQAYDEYELEAKLIDFSRETRSLFLKGSRSRLLSLSTEMNVSPTIENEKMIIKERMDLFNAMEAHYFAIKTVCVAIEKLPKKRNQLVSLFQKSLMFEQLLGYQVKHLHHRNDSWGKCFLVLLTLNHLFGVKTVVIGDKGEERSLFSQCILDSFADLLLDETLENIIQLVLQFDAICKETNLEKKSNPSLIKLRNRVWDKWLETSDRLAFNDKDVVNQDFLQFLPSKITHEKQIIPLIRYEEQSGIPYGYTEKGRYLFFMS